jgi:hypothetical protein
VGGWALDRRRGDQDYAEKLSNASSIFPRIGFRRHSTAEHSATRPLPVAREQVVTVVSPYPSPSGSIVSKKKRKRLVERARRIAAERVLATDAESEAQTSGLVAEASTGPCDSGSQPAAEQVASQQVAPPWWMLGSSPTDNDRGSEELDIETEGVTALVLGRKASDEQLGRVPPALVEFMYQQGSQDYVVWLIRRWNLTGVSTPKDETGAITLGLQTGSVGISGQDSASGVLVGTLRPNGTIDARLENGLGHNCWFSELAEPLSILFETASWASSWAASATVSVTQRALEGPAQRAFDALIDSVGHLADLDAQLEFAEPLQSQIENFKDPLSKMLRELARLLPRVSGVNLGKDIRGAFSRAHAPPGMAMLKGTARQVSYASRLRRKIISGLDAQLGVQPRESLVRARERLTQISESAFWIEISRATPFGVLAAVETGADNNYETSARGSSQLRRA